jgi:hypothetical protein
MQYFVRLLEGSGDGLAIRVSLSRWSGLSRATDKARSAAIESGRSKMLTAEVLQVTGDKERVVHESKIDEDGYWRDECQL